jgi:hypothetical protein
MDFESMGNPGLVVKVRTKCSFASRMPSETIRNFRGLAIRTCPFHDMRVVLV